MDKLSERIWGRGSVFLIIWSARWAFLNSWLRGGLTAGSYTSFAVAHYSVAKRYVKWFPPLTAWHLRWATFLDNRAIVLGLKTAEQADVVARHMAVAPHWLGGDVNVADALLTDWIYVRPKVMCEPHTRPLMLITLRDIRQSKGNIRQAWELNDEARKLIDRITDDRQRIRVLASVGCFSFKHGNPKARTDASGLIWRAYSLALKVSEDQVEKVKDEARLSGYRLS